MEVKECRFRAGEVYLFSVADPLCGARGSLWATYDKSCGGEIHLEACTSDRRRFVLWHVLPGAYRYCRMATRDELREYMTDMAFAQCGGHRQRRRP